MPQYLIAIQRPGNHQLAADAEATMRDISALNRELIAAGVGTLAGGLQPAGRAQSVRRQAGGEAVEWARKATVACRVPVEVRAFLAVPAS